MSWGARTCRKYYNKVHSLSRCCIKQAYYCVVMLMCPLQVNVPWRPADAELDENGLPTWPGLNGSDEPASHLGLIGLGVVQRMKERYNRS